MIDCVCVCVISACHAFSIETSNFYLLTQMELKKEDVSSTFIEPFPKYKVIFLKICIVGGGIKVHSTLRPLIGLLCQPRVIMMMEK
jgi:hypothetical protein